MRRAPRFRPLAPEAEGMVLTLVTGDRLHFRRFEVLRALLHPQALAYLVGGLTALIVLPVRREFAALTVLERIGLCVGTGAALMVAVLVLGYALERLQRGVVRIHASAVIAAAVLVAVLVGNGILHAFLGVRTGVALTLVMWAFFHVYVEAVMLLMMYRAMPRILRALRREEGAQAQVQAAVPMVRIGGHAFAEAELVRVEAEGNYLRVLTTAGRTLVPGPMGRAVDGLPLRLGLRVGRSDWVAARAVAGLRAEGRDLVLDLTNGEVLRVSQTRRKAVEDWLRLARSGQDQVDPDGVVVRRGGERGGQRIVRGGPEDA